VTRNLKIVALLAFGIAAGCRDSYPTLVPPTNILYYPTGLAVRQMPPDSTDPKKQYGWSQLVVGNANFDLRFDSTTGGTVVVLDPDAAPDRSTGQPFVPLGAIRTGSFVGELAMAGGSCPTGGTDWDGWTDCPYACDNLKNDPAIKDGGTKLIFASRAVPQQIYRTILKKDGTISCGTNCVFEVPIQQLDPYGVTTVCSTGVNKPLVAYAFVSQLMATNGLGYMNRVNLLQDAEPPLPLVMGPYATYASVYEPERELVFVSSVATDAQFRWFNPLVTVSVVDGFAVPDYTGPSFSSLVPGAVARDMALSSDGTVLYVTIQMYDLTLAVQTGLFYTQGGGLAIFDLTQSSFGSPRMALVGLKPTCVGAGQIRRLPARADPIDPDLFVITCDQDGQLVLYDSDSQRVVRTIGMNPATGLPILGLQPFGIAVEAIDPRRATTPVQGQDYPEDSPCMVGAECHRIYVSSFMQDWINVLELMPDFPDGIALVKRIGNGP